MALNLTMPQQEELKPRITVFGVGGAGGNAVNNMIEKNLEGVEFVTANTDAQALQQSNAQNRIQMGVKVTEGLGAGARPTVGAAAAEETIEEIVDHLAGAHMCFITAGMGGGTGTGAAPIIAQAARELGVLTVGVVTKPFQFEGAKRMRQAEDGVDALQKVVDTLIIIPNQNLFRLANEKTTFTEAFSMADDVLYQGVKGVTDLMVRPGLINLDFADVRSVMDEMGKAMMGTGEADGEDRAIQAAEAAIANPLLDEISLKGAKGVLINITGGYDLTLFELDEAANRIREEVDPDANIIVGSTLDTEMEGRMRVSVVATGIDATHVVQDIPRPSRKLREPVSAETAAAASHAAAAGAEADPIAEPVAARATAPAERARHRDEPSLFAATTDDDDLEDDLPPPAYQPPASDAFPLVEAADEDAAEHYVAPQPRRPGTPSPEALQRLQAAVRKSAPAGEGAQHRQPVEQTAGEKRGFGIGTLIHRMSGQPEAAAERPAPHPSRQQPPQLRQQTARPSQAYDDDPDMDPEQERIEIPAFLRRQAN
ncbi:cell division protein FtsZ [Tropicimonas isoalkanivorans]|uniref:Cell division protein FtsZ n=1 Tax=Tropicimonas isoalkanivorans TaxID=441112 RepID=A0A1I1G4X4_9RHOB|nr:cell division protein FtsZ [Tropicimonas isoalkanivorans]SFC06372.1 cell division protein FtsZ [Tropicimonas isoalkanivorans]